MKTSRITAALLVFTLIAIAGCNLTEPEPERKYPVGCVLTKPEPVVSDSAYRFPVETFITIDSYPAWSPNGRTIAYTHWPQSQEEGHLGEDMQIWLLDLESGKRRFITTGWQPAWSPDGKQIAFVRGILDKGDIFTIELASGKIRQITNWGWCFDPSWAPDGTRILFSSGSGNGTPRNGIWAVSLEDSGMERIQEIGDWPKWSPSDTRIAYIGYPGHVGEEVLVTDTTGRSVTRLTTDTRSDRHPSWSPDGAWITWDSYGEGNDSTSGIWIMRADGSEKRPLMYGGGFPSWSPDGKRIVFYKFFNECTGGLWVMNADGTDARPLIPPEVYGIPKRLLQQVAATTSVRQQRARIL